jgi:hypothetical protein
VRKRLLSNLWISALAVLLLSDAPPPRSVRAASDARLSAPTGKPKYPAGTVPLHASHDYFQTHAAATYWTLAPYYIAQYNDVSCSLAAAVMVLNAARSNRPFFTTDALITQAAVLDHPEFAAWRAAVDEEGTGVTLRELHGYMDQALHLYNVTGHVTAIEANGLSEITRTRIHEALLDTAQSANTLIIANFQQAAFLDSVYVGHFAPIGAYDPKNHRILIMDPDRSRHEEFSGWI